MIVIEYLIIALFLCALIGTAGLIISKYTTSSAKNKEARDALAKALESKSRQRIEDTVILYGDQIPDKIKDAVRLRVDELFIEEDDERLERKINEL
jgi:hypothetical protein